MQEPKFERIRSYEPSIVPGLLQVPAYAATILDDEAALEARLARQGILDGDQTPPHLLYVLDESVLYRDAGGVEVMRE